MKKQIVRSFAVGISDYSRTDFSSLPSAVRDAKALYGALATVLGVSLETPHSILATDITSDSFLNLFSHILEQDLHTETLLILYFSGHATIEQQVLTLHFVDSRANRYGVVTTYEIDELLRRFDRPETIIILDCCYSGLAGSLSKSANPFFPAKTTVLSSSRPYEVSICDEEHSVFTKALIDSLHFLEQSEERISVSTLHGQIDHFFHGTKSIRQNPSVFLREGTSDIVLKWPETGTEMERKQFIAAFANALFVSNPGDREALWYALNEYPESTIIDVIEETVNNGLHEPLWLIRRAMGSTLSSITRLHIKKKRLYLSLMGSTQWMDVCTGVIGARFNIEDEITVEALEEVLNSAKPMDAKWLAFLYLADRFHASLFERVDFSITGLTDSKWGVCEIWERCIQPSKEDSRQRLQATENLLELCKTEELQNTLVTHIALLNEDDYTALPPKYKNKAVTEIINDDNLVKYARAKQRGLLRTTGVSKWLYSQLYGVWRGQVQDSLTPILQDMPPQKARIFLKKCYQLPSVSNRIAIYKSLQVLPKLSHIYSEELTWGFKDEHPWVRRTAMEWLLFCSYSGNNNEDMFFLSSALQVSDRAIFPGVLDLIHITIRVAKYWGLGNDVLNKYVQSTVSTLAPSDLESIEWTMKNELLPFSFNK